MRHNLKTTGKSDKARKPARPSSKTRRKQQQPKGFQLFAPGLGIPSPNALILPQLRGVAPKLVNQKSTEATATVAVSMIDLGMACDEDAPFAETPSLFVERVFERWVKEKAANLKMFSPHFTLTDSLRSLDEYQPKDEQRLFVGVGYSYDDAVYFNLKTKFDQLEALVPGLGQTALHSLYNWLSRSLLALTPDFVFSTLQYQHWRGEDNERDFIEQLIDEGEDPADYEIIKLADFEQEIPPHAYKPSELVSQSELKRLSKHDNSMIAEAAALLLSQPDMTDWNRDGLEYVEHLGNGNQCIGYNLVLNWEPDGSPIATRICDDWADETYNSGTASNLFMVFQSEPNREGAAALFANLERYIATLEWLERAVTAFASPSD